MSNTNASPSTEIPASSEMTVLLCCKVHINKHLKAVYELFNYMLNMVLLSARSKAQQYPTCCATYTGAPGVIAILLPAENHIPNAVMITALPDENKRQLSSHYAVCRPSWLHMLNSRQHSVPGCLLWTLKGYPAELCHRGQVSRSVMLSPMEINKNNYTWESSQNSTAPTCENIP